MSAKKFEYTWNGKKIVLPGFANLPAGILRKTRNAKDPMDQAFLMIEELSNEQTLEIIDSMPVEEFGKMITEWAQGANPGESSDS
jgi:hypothetical protein